MPGPRYTSLVHGQNLTDVVITGANGTIDGQGAVWWAMHANKAQVQLNPKTKKKKTLQHTRGRLIQLLWSDTVEVSNLTLTNSPYWTVHPVYVRGFLAHHLWIINPTDGTAPETDGIDPDSSRDVLIHNVYIRTGDDAIAIKSGWDEYGYDYGRPSLNVTVRDSVLSSPCCAAVCIGSEMSGGVADVTVKRTLIVGSGTGFRIKFAAGRGGYVRDVSVEDVRIETTVTAIDCYS